VSVKSAVPGLWMAAAVVAMLFSFGSQSKAEATLASALAVCFTLASLKGLGQRELGSSNDLRDSE
jgi:ABC-type transport system involved in cytochrome c biogenesis permease component